NSVKNYGQNIPVAITTVQDFNRDGLVNATDQNQTKNNPGTLLQISISNPPHGPAIGDGDADGSESSEATTAESASNSQIAFALTTLSTATGSTSERATEAV